MAVSNITIPCYGNDIFIYLTSGAIPSKLEFGNYDTWRAHWVALLKGLNLMAFVDGSKSGPKEFDYRWDRQEQLVLHGILISISEKFLKRLNVSQMNTAKEAWDEIAKTATKEA
ncbi:hypothetical protein COLO4_21696 [Corchorus olitorius]|uniref:Retrotransposon Copia-like N-terminal domain-containing protein n=1 Tax=Corchorus olitorius TaxID=93759 RepID=A0A1R3IRK9_9ROSI|nr:hypothetical protein COLO4_21696 [Corchorus olitorius]